MKKTAVIFGILMIATVFSFQNATAEPFEQETYLFMKQDMGPAPWLIIKPELEEIDEITTVNTIDVPYGKLEFSTFGDEFCFDFKGYFPEPEDEYGPYQPGEEYALIYYVDPGPGPWEEGEPVVYVLGTGALQEYAERGKSKQFPFYGVKIKGCDSEIGQLPWEDDVNYPNGAKIWLVPLDLLEEDSGETTMIGWDAEAILFETSLITFGFVVEED